MISSNQNGRRAALLTADIGRLLCTPMALVMLAGEHYKALPTMAISSTSSQISSSGIAWRGYLVPAAADEAVPYQALNANQPYTKILLCFFFNFIALPKKYRDRFSSHGVGKQTVSVCQIFLPHIKTAEHTTTGKAQYGSICLSCV